MKTRSKILPFVALGAALVILSGLAHSARPVVTNSATPAELFRGAENGGAPAALILGRMYETGTGTVAGRSMEAAVYWYARVTQIAESTPIKDMVYVNQFAMEAAHRLGFIYEYGDQGIPKNPKLAVYWYLKAAEKGYYPSQYNLGAMYSQNLVTPPDDVEGYKWLLLAQEGSDGCTFDPQCRFVTADPPGHIKRLRARMTPAQIAAAERLAKEWKQLPLWVPAPAIE
jgi:TPR repeat protein